MPKPSPKKSTKTEQRTEKKLQTPKIAPKPIDGLDKIIEIESEDTVELIPGEPVEEDAEEEEATLDEEEIDPFKDKWEE